jgi:hypothetical protein
MRLILSLLSLMPEKGKQAQPKADEPLAEVTFPATIKNIEEREK